MRDKSRSPECCYCCHLLSVTLSLTPIVLLTVILSATWHYNNTSRDVISAFVLQAPHAASNMNKIPAAYNQVYSMHARDAYHGMHDEGNLESLPYFHGGHARQNMAYEPYNENGSAHTTNHGYSPNMIYDLAMTSGSYANTTSTSHTATSNSHQPGFLSTVPAISSRPDYQQHAYGDNQGIRPPGFVEQYTHAPQDHIVPETDTFDMTHTAPIRALLPPPGPSASADEKIDFLQQQLDSFGRDRPIVGDLMSLGGGGSERRQGGLLHFVTFINLPYLESLLKLRASCCGSLEELVAMCAYCVLFIPEFDRVALCYLSLRLFVTYISMSIGTLPELVRVE